MNYPYFEPFYDGGAQKWRIKVYYEIEERSWFGLGPLKKVIKTKAMSEWNHIMGIDCIRYFEFETRQEALDWIKRKI